MFSGRPFEDRSDRSTWARSVEGRLTKMVARVATQDIVDRAVTAAKIALGSIGATHLASEAWTTWAPVVTQSGTVTHTARYAAYTRLGRTIHASVDLAMTGAGMAANNITVTIPVTANVPASSAPQIGAGIVYDASANLVYPGIAELTSSTAFLLRPTDQILAPSALGGAVFTAALASGDLIRAFMVYEAAS